MAFATVSRRSVRADDLEVGLALGSGANCTAYDAYERSTGERFA